MIFEPPASSALGSGKDELMLQLKTFLTGVGTSSRPQQKPQLCSTALYLLTHLPAARDAVLEYFGHVLDGMVARYNPQARGEAEERQNYNDEEEMILDELSRTLTDLVTTSPSPWASVVSTWCLDCLGKMSSKWSNKICGKVNTVHEKLSAWLSCSVGRVLLDLSADCLAKLMDSKVNTGGVTSGSAIMSDTDSCIAALLETSVKHAPHFDWVLGHIGSCFPQTMTQRVLSVGLRDFIACSRERPPSSGSGEAVLNRSPRLTSVVNILSHLTSTHLTDVQTALQSLLVSSVVTSPSPREASVATIPFMMALAGVSSGVRRALTTGLSRLLVPLLESLPGLYPHWVPAYFTQSSALASVTQLLLVTDRGGPQLLLLLLRAGAGEGEVATAARVILNTVLAELFTQVHSGPRHRPEDVPLLTGMAGVLPSLQGLMLAESSVTVEAAATLTYLFCVHKGRRVSAGVVSHLLCHATSDAHLDTCLRMVDQLQQLHTCVVKEAVTMGIRDINCDKKMLVNNLVKLCGGERDNNPDSWREAVIACQPQLGECLTTPELTGLVLQLFLIVPPDTKMRLRSLYRLSEALVSVILATVTSEAGCEDKLSRVTGCEAVLHQLARIRCGLQVSLRFLVDASLNTGFCGYIGGKLDVEDASVRQKQEISLLQNNYKHGTKPVQPLGSTVTFHAGVIGSGARPSDPEALVTSDQAEVNKRLVAGVIQRLCEAGGPGGEGAKQLALILVEIISPNIMYNGFPWYDVDFMRVTIERDLHISRTVARHPVIWSLLYQLAEARPALCYCSVLVRALLAVQFSHWQSHTTSSLANHPEQTKNTVRVLELMAIGQFTPPQLSLVPDIIHIFDPFQLHCVITDIWTFMSNNAPGPHLFVENEASGQMTRAFGHYSNYHVYCERLRMVMVKNIDTVAPIFKKYFVNALRDTNETSENGH